MFKIIGSLMPFLRSLLQFNFHLVTQGFTLLGEIVSALLLNFPFACTSLAELVVIFAHSVINLPFSIATILLLSLLWFGNLVFSGLCNVVFKCFKVIDLVFRIIGSCISFLGGLLQFNYHLVTQGFTLLGEIASTLLFGCTSLAGLVVSFAHYVINLPFSIATISLHYSGLLRENCQNILSISYDKLCKLSFDVVTSCGDGITIFAQRVARYVTISVDGLNAVLKECSFAIRKPLEIASKTSEFVVGLLKVLSHSIWSFIYGLTSMAVSAIMLLFQHITMGLYSIWLSVIDMFEAVNIIFERLGTLIAMPFSLANIKYLLGSIFALFQNIVHILLETLYFFCGLLQHSLNFIRESVFEAASCFIYSLKQLTEPSVWIILLVSTCLLVMCLVREGHIIRPLEALVVRLFQTARSYFNREEAPPDAQAAQNGDMLNQIRQNNLQNENNQQRNDLRQNRNLNGQNNLQRGNNEERENGVQRRRNQLLREDEGEQDANIKVAAPPPNLPQDDERHLCIVCQDNDRTTVLLPCKHLCLCHDCAVTLKRSAHRLRKCPLCRHQIENTLKVYL
eukprot:Seg432.1 transcript_id=Seg432.1/GoldUCD/mRNA.D3Y31 product="E3 ubiquitin-protein ligase RNF26" protein_id=Seg432.1/GoldUCD/D3Y31